MSVLLNYCSKDKEYPDADQYHPERDQSANLVYGAGIHACPGAPLARLELRLLVEELLAATASIRFAADGQAGSTNAVYPVAGYSSVRVVLD